MGTILHTSGQHLVTIANLWGLRDACVKGNMGICGIHPYKDGFAIAAGINLFSFEQMWCYDTYEDAKRYFDAWQGRDYTEPAGWYKRKP